MAPPPPEAGPPVFNYRQLGDLVFRVLKKVADQGIKPTPENLSSLLAEEYDFSSALAAGSHCPGTTDYSRELEAEKERSARRDDFMERAFLNLIRLARRPEHQGLDRALSDFRRVLTEGGDLDQLEKAMGRLRTEIVNAELEREAASDRSAEAPGGAKSEADAAEGNGLQRLEDIKKIYLGVLEKLDLDLSPEYVSEQAELKKLIISGRDQRALLDLRPRVEEVVRRFANQLFDDRNTAATFIAEVAQYLADMEGQVRLSAGQVRKLRRADATFNSFLGRELSEMTSTVGKAGELDNLKNLVMDKLSAIGEVLQKKKKHDDGLFAQTDRGVEKLHQEFDSLQAEIKKVKEQNECLVEKMQHDILTGAYNRCAYEEHLGRELERFHRRGRTFSLILFDIDNFKQVNDNHGHLVGDKCLQETVRKIKFDLRQTDILARYGGDEFVILLPETDRKHGCEVAEKIRRTMAMTDFTVRGEKVPVTVTLGVTEVSPGDQQAEDILQRADEAMYQAKSQGRNRVGCL